ncbi:MAG: hypothetical protein ACJAUP_000442 [Cellvibrionaceae bacterium]|jgi:hypothetical protein
MMRVDIMEIAHPIKRLPGDGSLVDHGIVYSISQSQIIMDRFLSEISWRSDTAFIPDSNNRTWPVVCA